jgi:hypothetical protein
MKYEFCWDKQMEHIKKFIPKYIRRSIKDKHGIVDGGSFFIHLFEIRLFLQSMPEEVVFLAFRAENKFSKESKYLLFKFIMALLGKYVVTPETLKKKKLPSEMTLNECIKSDKRLFLIFKPNLLFEDDEKICFADYQFDEMNMMNNLLCKTFFPINDCFGHMQKMQKKLFNNANAVSKNEQIKNQKSPSKIVIRKMIKYNSNLANKLLDFLDNFILSTDKKYWIKPKNLQNWGIWNNKKVLISKFHDTEDTEELYEKTYNQINEENIVHKDRFIINNMTLTLSKKKKQFLKNMINLNIPTIKNLFNHLIAKSSLHNFMFDLLKLKQSSNKIINIFKFDFVDKITIIIKLLIFCNSITQIEIVHFLVYEKNKRNFIKIKFSDRKRFFSNGMLFIPDLEKYISELKKILTKESNEKIKLKNRILVVFKVKNRLYLKYYKDQQSLLIRFHKREKSIQVNKKNPSYSDKISSKYFEINEKDELFYNYENTDKEVAMKTNENPYNEINESITKGRPSNLFGDNWQFNLPIDPIKEEKDEFKIKINSKNIKDTLDSKEKNSSKNVVRKESNSEEKNKIETQFSRRW